MRHPIVMRALLRAHAKFAQPRRRVPAAAGPATPTGEFTAESGSRGGGGWDPYEVWRTRVLLAREARDAALDPATYVDAAERQLAMTDELPVANRLAIGSSRTRRT